MRRLVDISGTTFLIFFGWKVALLLFTSQPVPANDAFFYDGPVVNYLLHDRYCNPSLAAALPISGTEIFCAYPPLYQFTLVGWMKLAGTSALAAMWFQVLLLGVFSLTTYSTLRRLQAPVTAIHWAGLFLFAITFHDRPDTLAQVLGALAVWAFVRGLSATYRIWSWACAGFLLLTFATSLQIGGIYALFLALLTFGGAVVNRREIPWSPVLLFVVALAGTVAVVKFGFPHLWAGFQEHVKVTPSIAGWRLPGVGELLKVGRAAAGIFLVGAILGWQFVRGTVRVADLRQSSPLFVAVCGGLASLALVGACLIVLTPNTIHIANYLQPLVVGGFLAAWPAGRSEGRSGRVIPMAFAAALLLVSIRAIGMSTWGVMCVRDVSRVEAITRLRAELDAVPPGSTVMISSAYLYDAAQRTNINWVHSDWPAPPGAPGGESGGIIKLRATRFILTQFDYYRRYNQSLRELRVMPNPPQIKITDTAQVRPPDAFPSLQRVLQHISWAPIVIEVTWPESPESNHENTKSREK